MTDYLSRVRIVLSEGENLHNQFSYEKLLSIIFPSDFDEVNQREDDENTSNCTQRPLYVSCFYAGKFLAVVFFADELVMKHTAITYLGLFPAEYI